MFADPTTAQFRVTMPTQYAGELDTRTRWGRSCAVSDNPGGGYEFSVTKTPQPVTALESYEQGLNRLAGQLASDAHAEIVHQVRPDPARRHRVQVRRVPQGRHVLARRSSSC